MSNSDSFHPENRPTEDSKICQFCGSGHEEGTHCAATEIIKKQFKAKIEKLMKEHAEKYTELIHAKQEYEDLFGQQPKDVFNIFKFLSIPFEVYAPKLQGHYLIFKEGQRPRLIFMDFGAPEGWWKEHTHWLGPLPGGVEDEEVES